MARCTAPKRGHRTASGRADCPACGGGYSYGSYSHQSYSPPRSSGGGQSIGGGGGGSGRPSWSRAGSSVSYTPAEVRTLTPVRQNVEKRASAPDLRDVFLCHAWDDRKGAAKELHDLLESRGVSVWFSEKDVLLGTSLLREIDKGLVKSRVGIVLVTPALLRRVAAEGIADKELSALLGVVRKQPAHLSIARGVMAASVCFDDAGHRLHRPPCPFTSDFAQMRILFPDDALARDLLVPIVHDTTYEALREVSPLLGSRSGLNTADEPMADVAAKLAELVAP